ncbi:hypothetical protein HAX54_028773 [Datura stramonium]|uniref:Uncharacterized protein n=1 Tax=Datura stramonium TaxID=4076 RepID=A0ABS8S9U8_DATST|nr:hypothetical protein [Datura stramonium]
MNEHAPFLKAYCFQLTFDNFYDYDLSPSSDIVVGVPEWLSGMTRNHVGSARAELRAIRSWNARQVLVHSTRFNACREDQEAEDALVPNCYKRLLVESPVKGWLLE